MKILKFGASWCQPCKSLTLMAKSLNLTDKLTEVNIDLAETKELMDLYDVRSVPSIVVLYNGTVVKHVGLPKCCEFLKGLK